MKIIPRVCKIRQSNDVFIERVLPGEGELNIKKGEKVEPFTKLGVAKVSFGRLPLPSHLHLQKNKRVGDFFYTGDKIGQILGKKIIAPFDGRLEKVGDNKKEGDGGFIFRQEKRDFWLLAGVWGEIEDFCENSSVMLKTQTVDLHFVACTKHSFAGELVVFPNPEDLLKEKYLEKFSKDPFGKIIYLGDHLDEEIVKKAAELGVVGLIGGSANRDAFTIAKNSGMFLGVFSAFGKVPTPNFIFEFLKEISNRFVFLQGSRGLLRVPFSKESSPHISQPTTSVFSAISSVPLESSLDDVPSQESFNQESFNNECGNPFTTLKEGLKVQVFQSPHFGFTGKITKVQNERVYVILDDAEDPIEVYYRNLLALE